MLITSTRNLEEQFFYLCWLTANNSECIEKISSKNIIGIMPNIIQSINHSLFSSLQKRRGQNEQKAKKPCLKYAHIPTVNWQKQQLWLNAHNKKTHLH